MPQDIREQARRLFMEVADLSETDRAAALARECGDNAALRAEVEALLRADRAAQGFMGNPTVDSDETIGGPATPSAVGIIAASPHELAGQMIGRYKLLQPIGEGGFGTVWMAEQRDPVKRRVALKIIKLGMDTKQVIARFEAERQALAMMDHPNIAKVFDAGSTEAGRPYFVMEYIKGVPILEYCDSDKLDTKSRLDLFVSVCNAIQHAHQKGIIHRDIKPSNILVTMHDGVPVPKVIDFGIAKATSSELTQKTLFTEHRQMIGTPAYMSPEQAEMSGLDIDTRSDIYSLGVLLYELLTGTTPFDSKSLLEAGFAEMMRIIREVEPHKPSTRMSSLGETGTRTALQRQAGDAKKLVHTLRGDLDWIVMKCLEKDRTRRYETASGLAADIQRHLSDEPVTAGAPKPGYKLRKFVKRNRGQVIAACLVAGVLVLGILGTTTGLVWALSEKTRADGEAARATLAAAAEAAAKTRAQENEKIAITQAKRAEAAAAEEAKARKRAETISGFVTAALKAGDAQTSVVKGAGQGMTILAAMDNAIRDIDSGRFKDDPGTEAGLQNTIATILQNNGQIAEAEPLFVQALETYRRIDDRENTQTGLNNLAHLLVTLGRYAEAEPLLVEALEMKQQRSEGDDPGLPIVLDNLAKARIGLGRDSEAEPLLVRALEIRRRLYKDDNADLAKGINNLAAVRQSLGQYAEAEPLFIEALEMNQRLFKGDHPAVATALNNVAFVLQMQSRNAQAEPFATRGVEMMQRLYKGDHPSLARGLGNLGSIRQDLAREAEAEPLYIQSLEMMRRLYKGDHPDVAQSLGMLAGVRQDLGRAAEAEPLFVEALELNRRLYKGDHPAVAKSLNNLAAVRQDLGRTAEAEALFVESLEMRRRIYKGDHPGVAKTLSNLANVRLNMGRAAEAEPLYVEAIEMYGRLFKRDDADVASSLANLARSRQALGKKAQARQGFDEAAAMVRRLWPDGSTLLARILWRSASARLDNGGEGNAAAALAELEEAVVMAEKRLPSESPQLKEYRETLGKCKAALGEQAKAAAERGK